MYEWRRLTPAQRAEALAYRKEHGYPWHGPPHRLGEGRYYHITAANYEHAPIIGPLPQRMGAFEGEFLKVLSSRGGKALAWCVLPNHYHALIACPDVLETIREIGRLHGRSSFRWNADDGRRGRQCWHRCVEREMRSERHTWATLNYVHHNPVHHGYVERWQDWPYSSAGAYLAEVGWETALERWRAYPLLEYGKGWDDPEL